MSPSSSFDSSDSSDSSGERIRSLRSASARRGTPYYLDLPPTKVRWVFEAGLPDPSTFPLDDLARIAVRVLRDDFEEGLQYGSGYAGSVLYGYEGLRDVLAERAAAEAGRHFGRREVMVTSGGVQALTLACRAFLDPGDSFGVEAPTWNAVLDAARVAGAEAVALPLDEDGLRVDVLEETLPRLAREGRPLKLLYTISTFHAPAGVSLSLARRKRLAALAHEWSFVILEDDVYGALRFEGEPLPSMLSLDPHGLVLRIESLSKTVAPALRIGWVTGHAEALAALSIVRGDLGVSQWLARVAAAYLSEGLYEPHLQRVNLLYRAKRDATLAALEKHCSEGLSWNRPAGGFFLWCTLAPRFDGREVLRRALAAGVVCRPGERFFGDPEQGRQRFRLSFVTPPLAEIEPGIAALGEAIRASAH
jgi:2-aminoadipate transaminase